MSSLFHFEQLFKDVTASRIWPDPMAITAFPCKTRHHTSPEKWGPVVLATQALAGQWALL